MKTRKSHNDYARTMSDSHAIAYYVNEVYEYRNKADSTINEHFKAFKILIDSI